MLEGEPDAEPVVGGLVALDPLEPAVEPVADEEPVDPLGPLPAVLGLLELPESVPLPVVEPPAALRELDGLLVAPEGGAVVEPLLAVLPAGDEALSCEVWSASSHPARTSAASAEPISKGTVLCIASPFAPLRVNPLRHNMKRSQKFLSLIWAK